MSDTPRPTPETDALMRENGIAIAQGKTRPAIWPAMMELERARNEARELLAAESRDAVAIAQKLIAATDQIQELQLALNAERAESANQMLVTEKLKCERDNALKAGGMLDIIDRAGHDRAAAIRERDEAKQESSDLSHALGQILTAERALTDRLADAVEACERWVTTPCAVKTEANKALAAWKEARK